MTKGIEHLVQTFKDIFGTYVVTWANSDKLIHTRQFHCRSAAQTYADKLRCRRRIDQLLDEYERLRLQPSEPTEEDFN